MRKINKLTPIQIFSDFVNKQKPKNWDDFHKYGQKIYEDTREQILITEQDCLCGYTELPINDVRNTHIDHYKKKSIFPLLTFDWNNFIVATMNNEFGANYKDSNYKIKKEEYAEILNPVIDEIQQYFEYMTWGEVKPKHTLSEEDFLKADKTIIVFNLNHNSLKRRRRNLIKMASSYKDFTKSEKISYLIYSGFLSLLEQYC